MVIRLTCDCAVADDAVMPIRAEKQCKEEGPLLCFLTMEMNERGYKIKGPH